MKTRTCNQGRSCHSSQTIRDDCSHLPRRRILPEGLTANDEIRAVIKRNRLPACLPACLCACVLVCLPICLSARPYASSAALFACLSIRTSIRLSARLSVSLPVRPPACLPVCSSVCLPDYLPPSLLSSQPNPLFSWFCRHCYQTDDCSGTALL